MTKLNTYLKLDTIQDNISLQKLKTSEGWSFIHHYSEWRILKEKQKTWKGFLITKYQPAVTIADVIDSSLIPNGAKIILLKMCIDDDRMEDIEKFILMNIDK